MGVQGRLLGAQLPSREILYPVHCLSSNHRRELGESIEITWPDSLTLQVRKTEARIGDMLQLVSRSQAATSWSAIPPVPQLYVQRMTMDFPKGLDVLTEPLLCCSVALPGVRSQHKLESDCVTPVRIPEAGWICETEAPRNGRGRN